MRIGKFLAFFVLAITYVHTVEARKHRHIKKKPTSSSFLFVSDVHLDPRLRITELGDDAGRDVWYAFVGKANQVMSAPNPPKFILYTGDLPVHTTNSKCTTLTESAEETHDTAIAAVLRRLRWMSEKYKTPVFYLPGNNDALAGDYMPFANKQGQTPVSLVPPSPMFFNPTVEPGKKKDKRARLLNGNPQKGYYAAQVMPGLRLVAMNTVMFNTECGYAGQAADEAAQMLWLRAQLQDAKATKNKVYIAMHIPPGNQYNGKPMWNTKGGMWQDTMLQLAAAYSSTITGILYGHTHMDEMRRLYAPGTDTVSEVAISCPGISAEHGNNPAFKVVTFDDGSKEIENFTTYYTTVPVKFENWYGGSYSFRSMFKCSSGTIYDGVKKMPPADFATYLNTICTAGNGPIDIQHVTIQMDVK